MTPWHLASGAVFVAAALALWRGGDRIRHIVMLAAVVVSIARALEPDAGLVAAAVGAALFSLSITTPTTALRWVALPFLLAAAAAPARLLQPANALDLLPGFAVVASVFSVAAAAHHLARLAPMQRLPLMLLLATAAIATPVALFGGRVDFPLADGGALAYGGPLLVAAAARAAHIDLAWSLAWWGGFGVIAAQLSGVRRAALVVAVFASLAALFAGIAGFLDGSASQLAGEAIARLPGETVARQMTEAATLSLAPTLLRIAIIAAIWACSAAVAATETLQPGANASERPRWTVPLAWPGLYDVVALCSAMGALLLAASVGRNHVGAAWALDPATVAAVIVIVGTLAAAGRDVADDRARIGRIVAAVGALLLIGGGSLGWRVASALMP